MEYKIRILKGIGIDTFRMAGLENSLPVKHFLNGTLTKEEKEIIIYVKKLKK